MRTDGGPPERPGRHLRPVLRPPAATGGGMTSASAYRPSDLARIKSRAGVTTSVCLPARNEEHTIGSIVETIRAELQENVGLVDELIVFDDASIDATAQAARRAGATVIAVDDVLSEFGPGLGKGDVLWRSLAASIGDLVVWCDSDIVDFGAQFVYGLLGPMLMEERVEFVKGTFDRPAFGGMGGGRVTELLARPLLSLVCPDLGFIHQPLSGSYAGRRTTLERLSFEADFGVDVGLLLDVADLVGPEAIAQVHLGEFRHQHRPLAELSDQANSVARAILSRRGGAGYEESAVTRPPVASIRRWEPARASVL